MLPQSSPAAGVLVLGDINVDVLARLENFGGLGEDYLVPALEPHCGGVGANVALALAKWRLPVRLLGCVGRDWFGDFALGFLKQCGVDVSCVERTEQALTGLFFIAVSRDGQRTMFGSRGANELGKLAGDSGKLQGIQAVHLVGYSFLNPSTRKLSERLMEDAQQQGTWLSLDVGMAPARVVPELILQAAKKASILFTSFPEAQALTGQMEKLDVHRALEECGIREIILKLGGEGCLLRNEGEWLEAPGFPVSAIDTTGAGDAFAAAFVRARLNGWPKVQAALLANAAGAAAASVLGAGEAMPEPDKILSILRQGRFESDWESVRQDAADRLGEELRSS